MRLAVNRFVLLFLALGSVFTATSQSLNHIGLCPTIDHSGTLSSHWSYGLYYFGMYNFINDEVGGIKDPAELFAFYSEQSISYNVTKELSLTGSYVYERQHPLRDNYRNENRFYFQSTYKYALGRTGIKHRLRYDGRFIRDRTTGNAPFSSRLRYLTGINAPLSKTGKCYFSAYNEFFFNTAKGATTIYGENWAYAAIGFKTGQNSSIEAGPLYIYWVTDTKNTLKNFYYLQLTWSTHTDFTK